MRSRKIVFQPVKTIRHDSLLSSDNNNWLITWRFISASTDNMLRVMAVSIEEDADRVAITVRLASNTGGLSSMMEVLGEITNILEKASKRGTDRLPGASGFTDMEPS